MYKIIGLIILSSSVSLYMLKNLYITYRTKCFLQETIYILKVLHMNIDSKRLYSEVFNNIDDLKYYKYLEFHKIPDDLINFSFVNRDILIITAQIFNNIGKSTSVKEKALTLQCIENLNFQLEKYSQKIKEDSHKNIIISISAGLLIFITVI